MHKPESNIEMRKIKILWNFELQEYHPISVKKTDVWLLIKKKV